MSSGAESRRAAIRQRGRRGRKTPTGRRVLSERWSPFLSATERGQRARIRTPSRLSARPAHPFNAMPEPHVLYRFWITDELTGKRRRTSYRMTEADAKARHGDDAVKDESTREERSGVGGAGDIFAGTHQHPPANTEPGPQ